MRGGVAGRPEQRVGCIEGSPTRVSVRTALGDEKGEVNGWLREKNEGQQQVYTGGQNTCIALNQTHDGGAERQQP